MFRKYRRLGKLSELRPYIPGEVLSAHVSIQQEDRDTGSPKEGDMIARNPDNHKDMWLMSAAYFVANIDPTPVEEPSGRDTHDRTGE